MIRAWLVKRREVAAALWREDASLSHLLAGTPSGNAAAWCTRRSRRRLRRADAALDLWTLGGRR